jgi:hypothetical protein
MSPEAIECRLRELSRLYKLGMALREPKWIWRGDIAEAAEAANGQRRTNTESFTTTTSSQ